MKKLLVRALALMGAALLSLPGAGTAEVKRIDLDIAGYLCGA